MRDTYIDVYLMGDKLQSIWQEDNVFTCIGKSVDDPLTYGLPYTQIQFNTGANVVRRFHHTIHADFVNKVIHFEAPHVNLPPVSGICPGCSCTYSSHHSKPANSIIFPFMQQQHQSPPKSETIKDEVSLIMDKMSDEVSNHDLLPHQVMFIFPIMKNNILADELEMALLSFWIDRFDDADYRSRVLANHSYWRTRIGDEQFYRHAFLHRSDENRPINLTNNNQENRPITSQNGPRAF